VYNCAILNAGLEAISLRGNDNTLNGCQVYADDNSTGVSSATDYYFLISGASATTSNFSNNNRILNCYAQRKANLGHFGHGFLINAFLNPTDENGNPQPSQTAKNNLVDNCDAFGIAEPYAVRGYNAAENVFHNCRSDTNGLPGGTLPGSEGRIAVLASAQNNTFSRMLMRQTKTGVCFKAFFEEGVVGGTPTGPSSNKFEHCVFQGCEHAIDLTRRKTHPNLRTLIQQCSTNS
jgi:hypothetical protein